ncbi:MAG: ion channel [Beijerinckiaceae bacterium]|nr:ion channel [Beijerinckiaceae bacterium]
MAMQLRNARRGWPRKLPMRVRAGEVQRHLGRARERIGDRLLTWLTVLLIVLTFVIVPLHASGLIVAEGYGLAIVLVMASYFLGASASVPAVSLMLTGVGLAIVSYPVRFSGYPQLATYLDAAAWITVGLALAYVVARAVFSPGRITYHRVIGAVLLYLTIGNIFVGFYAIAGLLAPQAFSGLSFSDAPTLLVSDLIYFSFATLTTVGYGDVLPVHPLARSLSNLEAIVGQLYPATLLARLVTLELEDRRRQ